MSAIDAAQWYENEHIVGEGIARSEVPREKVTVTTKVLPRNLGREDVLKTAEESRQHLGVDVIDLLYVHWPTNAYDADGTLGAFDTLYDETKIRGVGLSNFTPALLDEARNRLEAPLVAHQVEMHPFLPQRELVNHAQQHGYILVAYSPLAQGTVFDDPVLQNISAEHGVSIARVALAWLFERRASVPFRRRPATTSRIITGLSMSPSQQKTSPVSTGSTASFGRSILPMSNESTGRRGQNSYPPIQTLKIRTFCKLGGSDNNRTYNRTRRKVYYTCGRF